MASWISLFFCYLNHSFKKAFLLTKETLGKEKWKRAFLLKRKPRKRNMQKINTYEYPYHWSLLGFWKKAYEKPLEYFQDNLNEKDIVLDIGCGDGRLTALIAGRVKNVIAVDHQKFPLEMAGVICKHLGIDNIRFEQKDARNLGYKSESFDKVTCFDVIEHLPKEDSEKMIKEITRVLKKDGWLFLTTPNRKELRARIFGHKLIDKHYYEYSVEELKKIFENDFTEIKFIGVAMPLPIPRIEHFANVLPFRWVFNLSIGAGKNYPKLAKTILMVAKRR